MQLNEIFLANSFFEAETRTLASKEIRSTLRKGGYKLLGTGADATVWAKSDKEVIKIIMPDDGEGAGEAGDTFMKFYKFCKDNDNLDHLPRFIGKEVEVFDADDKEYIMVTMEKLSAIPEKSLEEAMIWALSDCTINRLSWAKAKKFLMNVDTWKGFDRLGTAEETVEMIRGLSRRELLEYEVIYKLMVLLYYKGRINKLDWDLHTENAMMRGDTIVITDPWFNAKVK